MSQNYQSKNTKIVATIADNNCEVEFLRELYNHGINVARLNTAHPSFDGIKTAIDNIRQVSDKIAILLDTKGPEVRTGDFGEPIAVEAGETVKVTGDLSYTDGKVITVNYTDFHKEVPVGAYIMINDGEFRLNVTGKDENALTCEVENPGQIKKKKTVNVPNVRLNLPSVTDKDRKFLEIAIEKKLDFIAHSFVRDKNDVLEVQKILDEAGSPMKIIAKIENREGVENIEEILDAAYGVMVARGDLGVEVPGYEVPLMQKQMISSCIRRSKPVIVATQMLESMIDNPRATRAEISDVANAILDGTGAVMLSGESAYGKYPVNAVRTMAEIALHLKEQRPTNARCGVDIPVTDAYTCLAKAAFEAANNLNVDAIICPTLTGRTANLISSLRPKQPIFAPCYDATVMRQLGLSHGVRTSKLDTKFDNSDALLYACVKSLVDAGELTPECKVVVIAGTPAPQPHSSNLLEIAFVKDILALRQK